MPEPGGDYTRPLYDIGGALVKYKRKMDHVRQEQVQTKIAPLVRTKCCVSQVQLFNIKNKVQAVLHRQGVLSEFVQGYYAYAWALNKSQRTFGFMVDRIREHKILRQKWERRGLNPSVLDLIDPLLIFNQSQP